MCSSDMREPVPRMACAMLGIPIDTPIPLPLFANLKPHIHTPLRQKPLQRSHFEIRRDERFHITCSRISDHESIPESVFRASAIPYSKASLFTTYGIFVGSPP